MKTRVLSAAAIAVACLAAAPASAAVQFKGTATGCFGASCTPGAYVPLGSTTTGGLTFTNGQFNQSTSDIDGSLSLGGISDNLGTFTLSGAVNNYNNDIFNLLVTFLLPTGTSPNPTTLSALLTGTVQSNQNGGVTIDFANNLGNPLFFNSDAGAFTFTINDLGVSSNSTLSILSGRIQAVPEPGTWAMMLLGFAGIGAAMRGRRRNATLAQVA